MITINDIALALNLSTATVSNALSGKGRVGEANRQAVIEKAKESNVAVHEDSKLANTLANLEIGEMIPPELYEAVAEILVFVDAMEKIQAKSGGKL